MSRTMEAYRTIGVTLNATQLRLGRIIVMEQKGNLDNVTYKGICDLLDPSNPEQQAGDSQVMAEIMHQQAKWQPTLPVPTDPP